MYIIILWDLIQPSFCQRNKDRLIDWWTGRIAVDSLILDTIKEEIGNKKNISFRTFRYRREGLTAYKSEMRNKVEIIFMTFLYIIYICKTPIFYTITIVWYISAFVLSERNNSKFIIKGCVTFFIFLAKFLKSKRKGLATKNAMLNC